MGRNLPPAPHPFSDLKAQTSGDRPQPGWDPAARRPPVSASPAAGPAGGAQLRRTAPLAGSPGASGPHCPGAPSPGPLRHPSLQHLLACPPRTWGRSAASLPPRPAATPLQAAPGPRVSADPGLRTCSGGLGDAPHPLASPPSGQERPAAPGRVRGGARSRQTSGLGDPGLPEPLGAPAPTPTPRRGPERSRSGPPAARPRPAPPQDGQFP